MPQGSQICRGSSTTRATTLAGMASGGERSDYFPKIEAKHGKPVEHWFDQLAMLDSDKYPDQVGFLKNEHGFSQVHANAVVMYYRGSTSSRRHSDPDAYFAKLEPTHRDLAKRIFSAILDTHPDLDLVIAWNQPMFRNEHDYVFGLSASTHHLSINPFSQAVLTHFSQRLAGYDVLKHTIRIPLDWVVDAELLRDLVGARIAETEKKG